MHIISINIGKPKNILWKNKKTITSIFKQPIHQPCQVSFSGIEGDEQADLRYHGGETKAVYSYDNSYYEQWKKILPRNDWQYGMFGENLTTKGLPDNEVRIGNVYKIGSTILKAMEPRFPCSKLNVRFGLSIMVKMFTQQKQNGIYFKIMQEGTIQKNDPIELIESSEYNITISDIVHCFYNKGNNATTLKNILAVSYLPKGLRKNLEAFL